MKDEIKAANFLNIAASRTADYHADSLSAASALSNREASGVQMESAKRPLAAANRFFPYKIIRACMLRIHLAEPSQSFRPSLAPRTSSATQSSKIWRRR